MTIDTLIDRIKLPFRKEKELYLSLYEVMGFYPHNIDYYKQALMHKSVSRRNSKGRPINNERLEFLGDAILDAIVGDIVYRHFEGKREGFLTNTRSKIVQRETLNRLANEIGVSSLIKSNSHSTTHNSYMEGNAFEALVGAIYLDRGYNACMRFMQQRILSQLINLDKVAYKEVNFKSKLIEWCQKNKVKLEFKLIEQKYDENNSPKFRYRVIIEGLEAGIADGYSKKESQQTASKLTLQSLRRNPQFIDEVFAAKANRTKMEEEPVNMVPDVDSKEDFIISKSPVKSDAIEPDNKSNNPTNNDRKSDSSNNKIELARNIGADKGKEDKLDEEFDLSDIKTSPEKLTKEDIIAAAEAEAFANNN